MRILEMLPLSATAASLLAVALSPAARVRAQSRATPSPTLTVERLARVVTPTGTRISPDGAWVLFTLAAPDTALGGYTQGIWRVRASGGRPERLVELGSLPRWSPDGRTIAFLSARDGSRQLWLMNTTGGGQRRLTSMRAGVTDFAWSPDGTRIAFIATVPHQDTAATEAPSGRPQVHLLDLTTRAVRQLTRSPRAISAHVWDPDANLSWSPDGAEIAYSEKPAPRFDDDYASEIHVVSAISGATRVVVSRPGINDRPLWSPDGKWIAFRTSFGSTDRFRASHGLGVVDARGAGTPRDVGAAFEGGFLDGPYTYAWADSGRRLLFAGGEPAGVAIFTLDVPSGTIGRFSTGRGKRAMLSLARDAGTIAFVMAGPTHLWDVFVSPITGYRPRRVTHHNAAVPRSARPGVEVVTWRGQGGPLDGVLLTPPGYDPRRRYPLLTYLHGGPEGQAMAALLPELPSPLFDAQLAAHPLLAMAARGYLVFLPNFRGSGGHGLAFRLAALGDWTAIYASDVLSGIDTLVARGIADPTRLGLLGNRSGGTKVLGLLARSGRFAAASVIDAHVDFALEYERLGDFRRYWESLLGGTPAARPDVYRAHSPIHVADRIATPLQIIATESAFAAPSEQSLALHGVLLKQRVPGELQLLRSSELRDVMELARRTIAWFDRWLVHDAIRR